MDHYFSGRFRTRWRLRWARVWTRYLARGLFVHINKTGGSSVEKALGMPFQHHTAREFIHLVGMRRWQEVYTFSFVRNPWTKVASHHRYRVQTNQTGLRDDPLPFSEWVLRAYGDRDPRYFDQPKMFMPQVEWLRGFDGDIAVDFVGRFERLAEDFAHIAEALGRDATLPHMKKSRPSTAGAVTYSDEAREVIAEVFREDCEHFGYSFPDSD